MAVRMGAAVALALLLGLPSRGAAQDQGGGAVFRASCASCHGSPDGAAPANAPDLATLRQASPEAILNTLLNGKMRIQATPLSDADRRAVAEFLGGRAIRETSTDASVVRLQVVVTLSGRWAAGDWNGWGNGLENTRFASKAGLTAAICRS